MLKIQNNVPVFTLIFTRNHTHFIYIVLNEIIGSYNICYKQYIVSNRLR